MFEALWPLLAFAPFFILVMVQANRRVHCPDCGERLPTFISPLQKTRRMWLSGGYLCAKCGCETDPAGRKVSSESPTAPFPAYQLMLVGFLSVAGVGLGMAAVLIAGRPEASPALVAAPLQENPNGR